MIEFEKFHDGFFLLVLAGEFHLNHITGDMIMNCS